MKPVITLPDSGEKLNVLGITLFIRVHGRDTGGSHSVVESHDTPGGGPPPHIHHREHETFQVLEGEYEFSVGGQTVLAGPGTTLFAPRGVTHTYRYVGQKPGKLLCTITPAGFEHFFEAVSKLTPEQQQEVPRVMDLAQQFGLEILPPP